MLSLRSTAQLLDPTSKIISTKHLAQVAFLLPPISLLSLMSAWSNKVDDVEQALSSVNKYGTNYIFAGDCEGLPVVFSGAHVQGIASYKNYLILTHNSAFGFGNHGSIIILNKETQRIVTRIDTSDYGYNHPGGIQQIDNYLAVPLENDTTSLIRFYDLSQMSDEQLPCLLDTKIIRENSKAGAVGITSYIVSDINYFLVAAVDDNGIVDFYKSNGKSLSNPECSFTKIEFEKSIEVNKNVQSLCLVTDKAEKIYMIGFRSSDAIVEDYADLYSIDINSGACNPEATDIQFISTGGGPFAVHFRYGAGLQVVSSTQIKILATERNFSLDLPNYWYISINIFQ